MVKNENNISRKFLSFVSLSKYVSNIFTYIYIKHLNHSTAHLQVYHLSTMAMVNLNGHTRLNICIIYIFETSIEKKKSNKVAEEGNFALPDISAKLTIFYYLIPNILKHIYIYIHIIPAIEAVLHVCIGPTEINYPRRDNSCLILFRAIALPLQSQ